MGKEIMDFKKLTSSFLPNRSIILYPRVQRDVHNAFKEFRSVQDDQVNLELEMNVLKAFELCGN